MKRKWSKSIFFTLNQTFWKPIEIRRIMCQKFCTFKYYIDILLYYCIIFMVGALASNATLIAHSHNIWDTCLCYTRVCRRGCQEAQQHLPASLNLCFIILWQNKTGIVRNVLCTSTLSCIIWISYEWILMENESGLTPLSGPNLLIIKSF